MPKGIYSRKKRKAKKKHAKKHKAKKIIKRGKMPHMMSLHTSDAYKATSGKPQPLGDLHPDADVRDITAPCCTGNIVTDTIRTQAIAAPTIDRTMDLIILADKTMNTLREQNQSIQRIAEFIHAKR